MRFLIIIWSFIFFVYLFINPCSAQTNQSAISKKYTVAELKEDTKINYVGDWTSYNYRKAMQDGGYKEGDSLGGKMFPTLFETS